MVRTVPEDSTEKKLPVHQVELFLASYLAVKLNRFLYIVYPGERE